jgi:hypothetical protein
MGLRAKQVAGRRGLNGMRQSDAVYQAMLNNGGYATLGLLYQMALKVPDCNWGTKTPFASIRRIVQDDPRFMKLRPGLWALTEQEASVLQRFNITSQAASANVEEFNHSYYQGLLVEIGNMSNFKTFVPYQDKNKSFLTQKLHDLTTLDTFHSFTYEPLLRRGRTVDVTWFNERDFPQAFYEVEHSTDIQNSLLKFLDFQDFRIEFYIVADAVRRREYETKLDYTAFKAIKSHVKFWDYEFLSQVHSKMTELVSVRSRAYS